MSENSVCIVCNESATSGKRLLSNPDLIEDLITCCTGRLSIWELNIKQLPDHSRSLSEYQRKSVCYYSECRNLIVNKTSIERFRCERTRCDSPTCFSCACDPVRSKRTKTNPKAQTCIFSFCGFCRNDTELRHRVYSDNMGENLLEIKHKTLDDQVRTCV